MVDTVSNHPDVDVDRILLDLRVNKVHTRKPHQVFEYRSLHAGYIVSMGFVQCSTTELHAMHVLL